MNENKSQTHCVACMEEIREGARVCPHCHSPQSPQQWRKLGSALKWLGGLTAITTLLVSAVQLNALLKTTRERAETVTQLIGAADRIAQAGSYKDAMQLVEQALERRVRRPPVCARFRLLWSG